MDALKRFGISLPAGLLNRFDREITEKGYQNRSEAFRDLIRQYLVKRDLDKNEEIVGVLSLVYDHHVPSLSNHLNDLQHNYHEHILSNTHIHLDHQNCLEVIILKGRYSDVKRLSDRIIGTRGVKHGDLSFTSTGKNLTGV
ncbi:nickel-responsive transcriptional regulator NikR [bacterium]|nr:nickel-responsive transcriptional regulator NikR [bacterium]MBU1064769.1 nickel-responsive transcriptional regulator NikR [bacterium]MBU1633230.1 nickel-responsive transcriptional regulator NikR [bacterium]MBU1874177.1 nickel-responsive transcriptional regulator NikR [bacterium]